MISFVDFESQRAALGKSINEKLLTVVESGQYVLGPWVSELENVLCEYLGIDFCITCANGTDAITASLMALGVGPGDEIITPAFSYIAAAESIISLGAKPVFIEVDPLTHNIEPKNLVDLITPKTKVVIAISLFGQPCELIKLKKICESYNISLIEDAAQSFGATHHKMKSCSIADISTTSFFPTKPLGCYGDGGAIFTNHEHLSEKIRMIVRHGQSQKYKHEILGMNSRLDSIQAAILLEKIKILDREIEDRNCIAAIYNKKLQFFDHIKLPKIEKHNMSAIAQYTIQTDNRNDIIFNLKSQNIPYAIHYPLPIYKQKFIKEKFTQPELDVTEKLSETVLSLPLNAYMTEDDVDLVCGAISK